MLLKKGRQIGANDSACLQPEQQRAGVRQLQRGDLRPAKDSEIIQRGGGMGFGRGVFRLEREANAARFP